MVLCCRIPAVRPRSGRVVCPLVPGPTGKRMDELLTAILFWTILLFPIAVFLRQFRLVRCGRCGKRSGVARFVVFSIVPLLAYVLVFFALVATEEITGRVLIAEGMGRVFALEVGISLAEIGLLTAVLVISIVFLGPVDGHAGSELRSSGDTISQCFRR